MKKFRFPLRSVATLRRMKENERREIFASALRKQAEAEAALAQASARIAGLEQAITRERSRTFKPADQIAFLQALAAERVLQTEAAAALAKAKSAAETERLAWLASRRDVRLVEVLENKSRLAHQLAVEREEQALLDDRTNALFARAS